MRIECTKEKLLNALTKTERVTVKNPTLPILKCVLFDSSKDSLKIRATNLDVGIEIEVPARVKEEGSFAVPSDVVTHLISHLPQEEMVVFESGNEEATVSVSTKNTTTVINTYPSDDFPTIPSAEGDVGTFTLPAPDLVSGIRSVSFSASTSNIKPELSSIYIYGKSNNVYFVATDSFRLSERRIEAPEGIDDLSILLPYKNTSQILRSLDEEGEVGIRLDKNQASFIANNIFITSRVIDGVFPDYHQIIPTEFETKITLLKEDLINLFKLNSVFSDEFKRVVFKVSNADKKLLIETHNKHIGKVEAGIDATIEGEDLEVSFNHKYITDSFSSLTAQSLSLEFGGKNKPLIIKGVSDTSFMYLVMPMNK